MFGPKHTLESVAHTLSDGFGLGTISLHGFGLGTISLHPDRPSEVDVTSFETDMKATLVIYRRREILLLLISTISVAMGLAIMSLGSRASFDGVGDSVSGWNNKEHLALVCSLLSGIAGFVFGRKTHEKSIELKTYIRVLKIADPTTAQRLVTRVSPEIHPKQLAS